MGKHLISYGLISDLSSSWEEVGTKEYLKKRLKFWAWRKHRTMGRPVLVPWRANPQGKEE